MDEDLAVAGVAVTSPSGRQGARDRSQEQLHILELRTGSELAVVNLAMDVHLTALGAGGP